jgi:hypothetical protein
MSLAQGEIGNGDVGGGDLDNLGCHVVAVEDDGLAVAAGRAEGDVPHVEAEVNTVQVVGAVGDEDGLAGTAPFTALWRVPTVSTVTVSPVGGGSGGQK